MASRPETQTVIITTSGTPKQFGDTTNGGPLVRKLRFKVHPEEAGGAVAFIGNSLVEGAGTHVGWPLATGEELEWPMREDDEPLDLSHFWADADESSTIEITAAYVRDD